MHITHSSKIIQSAKGFTLLEVTAVVTVMLGLLIVLFLGAKEYKKGADRAACIQNIATMQRIVRSYGNLYGAFPGESVSGLQSELVGTGKFIETPPVCPAEGNYTYLGDALPAPGVLYLDCSISEHLPVTFDSW